MTATIWKKFWPWTLSFFSLFFFHFAQGQAIPKLTFSKSISIPQQTTQCFVDPLKNIYFVNHEEITRVSTLYPSSTQSIKAWQGIDDIETINSLKIALFSARQQQICFTDNTLSLNGPCIELEEFGLYNATSIAASKRPDMIWIYDELNSRIILFNFVQKTIVQSVNNLKGMLQLEGNVQMNENEFGLWISSNGKLTQMDDYLNVVQQRNLDFQNLFPFGKGCFFTRDSQVYYFDFFIGEIKMDEISTPKTMMDLYIAGNELIIKTMEDLKVFIIQP